MRKKNTSDRKNLKTKYTNQKKRRDRKVKIKKDMKKNPNKYHKKKSDPGVPNIAPFKLDLLNEREQYLHQKSEEKEKKRQQILKARQAMREKNTTNSKRKLTEVINLKPSQTEDSDDDDSEQNRMNQVQIPDDEMQIDLIPKKRRKTNEGKSVAREQDDDMELDDEERERRQAIRDARQLAKKADKDHKIFVAKHRSAINKPVRLDPDARFHNWADKVYYKQVKLVVDAADILLEVLDARDPLGTRCSVLESIIRSRAGKRLVFVLNKADLIPKSNLQAWLKHFRAEGPTVAFKAATHRAHKFKKTVDRWVHIGEETLRTPSSMGSDVLLQLLKNYARSYGGVGIVVGVVGLPNVGKSSLINSLKKLKTCDVAPMPGSTKHIKEIKLDAKLHLIDSPGVVLPGEDMNHVDAILRNLVKLESIRDPIEAATEIFNRSDNMKLALFYEVRKVDTAEEFLGHLARRCKKMVKNGLTDVETAARRMIYDWNHGVLKYYTEPPKRAASEVVTTITKINSEFELDTEASLKEDKFMSYLHDGRPSTTMKLQPSQPVTSCYGLEEQGEGAAENSGEEIDDKQEKNDDNKDVDEEEQQESDDNEDVDEETGEEQQESDGGEDDEEQEESDEDMEDSSGPEEDDD